MLLRNLKSDSKKRSVVSSAENEDPAKGLSAAKRARNEAYRKLILEAAEGVFADKGYEGSKIQEVAAAAGLALGTIYGLYEGKAAIHRAVHAWRLGELFSVLKRTLARREKPTRLLLEGNAELMRWLAAHPRYLAMHLRGGHSWGAADAYRSDVQHEAWTEGNAMLAAFFDAGITQGTIAPGDPYAYARVLPAMIQVYVSKWSEAQGALDLEDCIDELNALVARSFFQPSAEPHDGGE